MRLFGKIGGTLKQLRAALLSIPFDLAFGGLSVPKAMAAKWQATPRYTAVSADNPKLTAAANSAPTLTAVANQWD